MTKEAIDGVTQEDVQAIAKMPDEELSELLEDAQVIEEPEELVPSEEDKNIESEESATEELESKEDKKEEPSLSKAEQEKQIQDLQKQIEGQELLVKRRISEFGELKKKLNDAIEKLEEGLEQKFIESPKEAMEDFKRIEEAKNKIEQINTTEQQMVNAVNAQKILTQHIDLNEVSFDDMAEALASDGIQPEYIQAFKTNPYNFAQPETLVMLAKRARAEKALKKAVGYLKTLMEENEQLKKKPSNILSKVEKTFNQPTPITASSGNSKQSKKMSLSEKDIHSLTDDELNNLLSQMD